VPSPVSRAGEHRKDITIKVGGNLGYSTKNVPFGRCGCLHCRDIIKSTRTLVVSSLDSADKQMSMEDERVEA